MENKIKDERLRMGITQAQLADMIDVSRQSIIAIEQGKYIPSTILALKIAKALGNNVEYIFTLEDSD